MLFISPTPFLLCSFPPLLYLFHPSFSCSSFSYSPVEVPSHENTFFSVFFIVSSTSILVVFISLLYIVICPPFIGYMFVSFHTSFFFSFFSCSFNSQFYPCYYSPRSTAFLLSSFCPMTFPFVLFTTFLFFPSSVPLPMLLPDPVFKIISLFFLKSATFQYNPSLLPF
jgi:hypothetical protein